MEAGGMPPAGSARALRLDPFALPVRYPAKDAGADGQVRQVELDRERVVLRRAVRGMRMKRRIAGVGIPGRHAAALAGGRRRTGRRHAHARSQRSRALSVPLYTAQRQRRGRGDLESLGPRARLAAARAKATDAFARGLQAPWRGRASTNRKPRRRRRSAIKRRRPSILLRRKPGRSIDGAIVHRGEHEIIARN